MKIGFICLSAPFAQSKALSSGCSGVQLLSERTGKCCFAQLWGQLKKRNITYVKAFQQSSDENKTHQNSITARFTGKLILEDPLLCARGPAFLMT